MTAPRTEGRKRPRERRQRKPRVEHAPGLLALHESERDEKAGGGQREQCPYRCDTAQTHAAAAGTPYLVAVPAEGGVGHLNLRCRMKHSRVVTLGSLPGARLSHSTPLRTPRFSAREGSWRRCATTIGHFPDRTELLGRNAELAQLYDLIDAIGQRGGALVVRGEAEIGKSALLEAAAVRAGAPSRWVP